MKIAYIAVKGMPLGGGIETFTDELGARLVQKGHEITAYTIQHYGSFDGYYRGMRIRAVPTVRSRSFEKMHAWLCSTMEEARHRGTDIIHFHAFGSAAFSLLPRARGMCVIQQGHGIEWKRSKWRPVERLSLKLLELVSVRSSHALTVPSRVQQAYLMKQYGIASAYIPYGISPPQIEPPELIRQYGLSAGNYILFAARLVREKGAHYLIEAFNRIDTDIKLVIAGDAKYEDAYKAELHRLAAHNPRIIFMGFVAGKLLHELFSNCYMFVLPSEIEGLSIALLEAMSYGNCCLVSDIPENLEALNGLGYAFRDKDVGDLTDKLNQLLHRCATVERFKREASDYVRHCLAWDSIANQFESFYLECLNRMNGRTRGM
jgi:glycosyltransferase involved in cell wall biosynthesis